MLMVVCILFLTTHNLMLWYLGYGVVALCLWTRTYLLCNMGAELCPDIPPNRLLAVGNCLTLPFVVGINTLGGAVLDWTGTYRPLFVAVLAIALVALLGFAFLVREPRSGRLYMIKIVPRV